MKEGKTTTNKNNAKNKKPSTSKVREVKVHEHETVKEKVHEEVKEKVHEEIKETEDFLDDEEDDKRLIIFIALAILVIVATVIGLLVGCNKEEKAVEEPKKPDDTIVVPNDEEEDKKDEEAVVEKVVAVTKTATSKKTTSDTKYNVTFYLNGDENVKEVSKGNKVNKYTPLGYTDCKYYTDENMTHEYDFNTSVTSNKDIYMSCRVIVYEIVYDNESNNPSEYTIEDGNILLTEPINYDGIFQGWYLNNNKITKLTKDILTYANKNNQIHLTAKIVDHLNVNYYDYEGKLVNHDEVTKDTIDSYVVIEGQNDYCDANEKFLGWSNSIDNNNINTNLRLKEDREDKSLYAVCGAARVVYKNGDEEVVVGYDETELEEYSLPTPEELGMEVPTYFVPVDEETLNSKKVVSDDTEAVADNEVKLSDVASKSASGYTPNVGDNVEEKEKEFKGWKEKQTEPLDESTLESVPNAQNVENVNDTQSTDPAQNVENTQNTETSQGSELVQSTEPVQDSENLDTQSSDNVESNPLESTPQPNSQEVSNEQSTLTENESMDESNDALVENKENDTSTNSQSSNNTLETLEPNDTPVENQTKQETKSEEVVPETWKPSPDTNTTLEAVWEEQEPEGVGEI